MLRSLLSRLSPPAPPLDPQAAYRLWAATYPAEAHNPLMRAEQEAVLELLPDQDRRPGRALDLACGSGRYLRHLQGAGAGRVAGFDLSAQMLARAGAPQADVAQADMLKLPVASETFDLVVCGLAVGHLPELGPALREAARVLKPGGVLVYSDFHPLASLAGWKRAFQANGRAYSVRHHLHLYADHQAACRAAGLCIDAVREPLAVDDAGARAWGDVPVALVVRATKP